ncbi:hypothetical protein GCM10025868_14490 [Angustibacter aerolatus]|uniref:Uncharacterized protein n=1 Tax=Angustibacter aerolatus TaxID=1162965 RepID=A0ABQ6JFL4_9ACTN|nr:hypothetical protein [Angustibacter aerolatus]GMA86199.1 hypothetical protein GCM10025868_14490 [Angustibacter aerolatus]
MTVCNWGSAPSRTTQCYVLLPRTRSRVGRRAGSALAGVLAAATIVPLTGTPAHALAQAAGTGDALGVVAQDSFSRSAAGGLGTADVGGSWTVAGAGTEFSVASSVARLRLSKPGAGTGAYLLDTSATDVDLTRLGGDRPAPTGGGTYVYVEGRRVAGAGDYRLCLRYLADRTLVVALLRVQGGTETTLGSTTLAGWTTAAGKQAGTAAAARHLAHAVRGQGLGRRHRRARRVAAQGDRRGSDPADRRQPRRRHLPVGQARPVPRRPPRSAPSP